MKLAEIEKAVRERRWIPYVDIEDLLSKLYLLKNAIEKHKQECYFSNPNDSEFMGYQKEDEELYKSAEDL